MQNGNDIYVLKWNNFQFALIYTHVKSHFNKHSIKTDPHIIKRQPLLNFIFLGIFCCRTWKQWTLRVTETPKIHHFNEAVFLLSCKKCGYIGVSARVVTLLQIRTFFSLHALPHFLELFFFFALLCRETNRN